jgi:hypothetical protein
MCFTSASFSFHALKVFGLPQRMQPSQFGFSSTFQLKKEKFCLFRQLGAEGQ